MAHKQRIGIPLYVILVTGAVVADGIQALLKLLWLTVIFGIVAEAISWLISGIVLLVYGYIFSMQHIPLGGRKYIARFSVTIFLELLPFLSAIPSLTVWTIGTVRQSRKEDAERRALEEKKAAESLRSARMRRTLARGRQEQELRLRAESIARAQHQESLRAREALSQARRDSGETSATEVAAPSSVGSVSTHPAEVALLKQLAISAARTGTVRAQARTDGPFQKDYTEATPAEPGKTRRFTEPV